jgi:hypothetical protein
MKSPPFPTEKVHQIFAFKALLAGPFSPHPSTQRTGAKPLPVALRQFGTTGKLSLHGDPKSVA